MKVTILDGSQADDRTGKDVSQILRQNLAKRDDEVSYFLLRDEKIGNCAGDFFCWVRYPGQCMINDVNREIAAAVATTDLLVYLTPITFGGYSSELKSMVDHQIQNIAPFFARVNGESHHQKRYDRYPDFLVIGWGAKSKDEETVFRNLVRRNQLNFYSQNAVAGIIPDGFPLAEMEQKVAGWLQEINRFHSLTDIVLPADEPQARQWAPVRRSVLLVGSPKTRKSSSHFLGSYLQDQLAQQGVETETFFVHTTLKNVAKWQAVLDAVDKADLVTLTYPLYVDSLPAPMIEALERIAAHRAAQVVDLLIAGEALGAVAGDFPAGGLLQRLAREVHLGSHLVGELTLGFQAQDGGLQSGARQLAREAFAQHFEVAQEVFFARLKGQRRFERPLALAGEEGLKISYIH